MAIRCFKLAALYLILGMTLGAVMGATKLFAYAPVHAHINLLGWVSLTLAGLLFTRFPHLAKTRLAAAFFWIYNIAVPVSMVLLALEVSGHTGVETALGISSAGIWVGGVCLSFNLLLNLHSSDISA
ncbi:MAG TPA: DUF2871 family protein [Rhodocyclaceae bacterium]|nr:DUF2871 family protein [Rhodocyclaceae bacterium]